MLEVEVKGMLGPLYQIALDEIDSPHPQCGCSLRILHRLADDLQAQSVCTFDDFAHFVAYFRRQRLVGEIRRQSQVAQWQLFEQQVGCLLYTSRCV